MSKQGEMFKEGMQVGMVGPLLRDMEGAPAVPERVLLERLARDVMGWYVFGPDEIIVAEEIEAKAPCALHDGPDDLPLLQVFDWIEQVDILHKDGKTERAVYGRHWNPLNEIHDAWDLLEAFQKRGTPLLLDPQVFGCNGPVAARVISMTALDAFEQSKKGLVVPE